MKDTGTIISRSMFGFVCRSLQRNMQHAPKLILMRTHHSGPQSMNDSLFSRLCEEGMGVKFDSENLSVCLLCWKD
jgi:hypothetical protein